MQRPSPGSVPFTPRNPSHLAPQSRSANLARAHPRGAVSMPTSPLGISSSLWDAFDSPFAQAADQPQPQPQTAHALFAQIVRIPKAFLLVPRCLLIRADSRHQPFDANHPEAWYEPATTTSTESIFPTAQGSSEGFDEDDQGLQSKKRSQVRIACTHCQKACKRCSSTRFVNGVSHLLANRVSK